jgi:hypothetical protein
VDTEKWEYRRAKLQNLLYQFPPVSMTCKLLPLLYDHLVSKCKLPSQESVPLPTHTHQIIYTCVREWAFRDANLILKLLFAFSIFKLHTTSATELVEVERSSNNAHICVKHEDRPSLVWHMLLCFLPCIIIKCAELLLHIHKVLGSNTSTEIAYPD